MTFHKWRQELRASDSGVGATRVTARVTGLLLSVSASPTLFTSLLRPERNNGYMFKPPS